MRIVDEGLTFDDVSLVPAFSEVLPRAVSTVTHLTRDIQLNIPVVSAAMDTVTEARLAIAMAQEGGIGVIHKSMSPEEQGTHVRIVKKYESGIIRDPITVPPSTSIEEVLALTRANNISGVPVVDGKELVGIVTSRDLRFETRLSDPVSNIMTPKDRLVTVQEGASQEEVLSLLHKHRIEKVLVINDDFELKGLITVKDIQKSRDFPNASKDSHERLRVAAAVGTLNSDTEQRLETLLGAGVDVIVVDTAHGHSAGVVETVRHIRKHHEVAIVAGNIVTSDAAKDLASAGADGVKVGVGPGSICTTRIIAGVGVPQVSAVAAVAGALKGTGIPVIADGGIRFSGDVAKAIAAGADSVMIGSLFAGTEEAPGEVELFQGRSYKSYRGMGSLGAMERGSSDRYFQDRTADADKLVPEGIEGRVPYKGPINGVIHQLMGGLRASMGYLGCEDIGAMHTRSRFVRVSLAGVRESHVHDVAITKEPPNYRVDR